MTATRTLPLYALDAYELTRLPYAPGSEEAHRYEATCPDSVLLAGEDRVAAALRGYGHEEDRIEEILTDAATLAHFEGVKV